MTVIEQRYMEQVCRIPQLLERIIKQLNELGNKIDELNNKIGKEDEQR